MNIEHIVDCIKAFNILTRVRNQKHQNTRILIYGIEAIPRYRDLQRSTVTVLIRRPIVWRLLTGSFVVMTSMPGVVGLGTKIVKQKS